MCLFFRKDKHLDLSEFNLKPNDVYRIIKAYQRFDSFKFTSNSNQKEDYETYQLALGGEYVYFDYHFKRGLIIVTSSNIQRYSRERVINLIRYNTGIDKVYFDWEEAKKAGEF